MEIAFVLKVFLSAIGLGGVGTAIGVPLALKSRGLDGVSAGGGSLTLASISVCDQNSISGREEVNFGSPEAKSVCGEVNPEQQKEDLEKFTSFFRNRGDNKGLDWNDTRNQDEGNKQCLNNDKGKGAIVTSSDGRTQHLGLCDSNSSDLVKFVKKEKKQENENNIEEGDLRICQNDCWSSSETVGGITTYTQEKPNSGKTVKFYKS